MLAIEIFCKFFVSFYEKNYHPGIECGDILISGSPNKSVPRVSILSREVGGRATFSCQTGYGLRGPAQTTCLASGEWSTPFPTCTGLNANGTNQRQRKLNKTQFNITEVQCDNPAGPGKKLENMYAQGSPPYRAGDVIQFNCNPEYMMQGQPIIACQDNGRWSGVIPKCNPKHLQNN